MTENSVFIALSTPLFTFNLPKGLPLVSDSLLPAIAGVDWRMSEPWASIAMQSGFFTVDDICEIFQVSRPVICCVDWAADTHIPGDTTTPPPLGAIQIGPTDIS